VIHERGDVRREECDVGINKLNGSKGAVCMKLFYEIENLVPVPYLLFDIDEVR
jgi:hypothetical protein